MSENGVKMLEFPQKGDERGHLVIVEGHKDVPFDIKRIFYIYGSDTDVYDLKVTELTSTKLVLECYEEKSDGDKEYSKMTYQRK